MNVYVDEAAGFCVTYPLRFTLGDQPSDKPSVTGPPLGSPVEQVPVHLSWHIVFVKHNDSLYRLMYWPVDVPEAKADIDELYQVTINTFAFTK